MYSVMLAAMLTTTGAAPDWGWNGGCGGCTGCHGCYGYNAFSYNCCGGCHGCYGGCYGCCGGCWGSCYGCCGGYTISYGSCYGCCGGCCGGTIIYSSCYGCYGCCGGTVVYPPAMPPAVAYRPAPVPPPAGAQGEREKRLTDELQQLRDQNRKLEERLKKLERGKPSPAEAPAHVVVKLPADARLFIDDVACPLTSTKREFDTPALKPEVAYGYTLRAEVRRDGRRVTESKKVTVQAGKETVVEFGAMSAVQTAGR